MEQRDFEAPIDRAERCQRLISLLCSSDLSSGELPRNALAWLLGDPVVLLCKQEPPPLDWTRLTPPWTPASGTGRANAAHECVELHRRLTYDRQFGYRVHRFRLYDATAMNDMLREITRTRDRADGIIASNVGGYHSERDLFSDSRSQIFHDFLTECIARAEETDEPFRDADGAASTSELRAPTEAWLNASQKEALNLLHHHSDSTWSGAYYVDDGRGDEPGFLGGQLLLRLTPGGGHGSCEPDEENHVPRMALRGVYASASYEQWQYLEVRPEPGSLILFPSWLSHAVAPHFGSAERISVSFNVSLKNTLKGDEVHEA
jgi:hypothetical protein